MMAIDSKKRRLIKKAETYKKAWILLMCWIGVHHDKSFKLSDFEIPRYEIFSKKTLENHVEDLREDCKEILDLIVYLKTKYEYSNAITWMSQQLDYWYAQSKGDLGIFTLCTAIQFENEVGSLKIREEVEVPPYAELLLQGPLGLAIRHPEYMLIRDLGLMYDLYRDTEDIQKKIEGRLPFPEWGSAAGENWQSFARSVIITCFNLLESFISGVARTYLMEHSELDEDIRKKLTDNRKPLKNRLVSIPLLITGFSPGLDVNKPPLSELFGPIKQRRDAFVHCEPGPQTAPQGYVKERMFHDLSQETVDQCVGYTFEIIAIIWSSVNGNEKPKWLPKRRLDGRFGKENLRFNKLYANDISLDE
ncbi:hypothetical protein ACFL0S_00585 [Thermodesulfobacteriota bacterium]